MNSFTVWDIYNESSIVDTRGLPHCGCVSWWGCKSQARSHRQAVPISCQSVASTARDRDPQCWSNTIQQTPQTHHSRSSAGTQLLRWWPGEPPNYNRRKHGQSIIWSSANVVATVLHTVGYSYCCKTCKFFYCKHLSCWVFDISSPTIRTWACNCGVQILYLSQIAPPEVSSYRRT